MTINDVDFDALADQAALAHFGVLGMKWGKTRARATSPQVHRARTRVAQREAEYVKKAGEVRKSAPGTKKRIAGEKQLTNMKLSNLKNPDRVISARMSRGEKSVSLLGAGLLLPVIGLTIPAAGIAGTSLRSRRIEWKQETGQYDKK